MGASTAAYDALRDAAGILDGAERTLVRVWGDRARDMIGGLLTSHVAGLAPDHALYAFMLTPKGRPLAELRALVPETGEVWLDMPSACGEAALEHLRRYLPPFYARFERLEERRRLSVVGPRSAEVVGVLPGSPDLAEIAPLELIELPSADVRLVRREPAEGPGADLYVPTGRESELRDDLVEAAERAGGGASDAAAYDIWRIERGLPVYGREIDLDVLPQETGQDARAIDYDKGCYTGQEVVARIHFRGHVNRRLVGLRLPEGPPPEPGTELFDAERSRGHVTSVADSPRLGPLGLGYVRHEVAEGARLAVGHEHGPAATVASLPFAGAAPPG
ncbi:MAG: glycine cleavage T C-terminal barrel domain-containing protein [Candidatus Palauibacterales bacterium]|nr:glycine cleavage T C-terminal barrel domain-containing protein [Candidatus Palauibacterales bacterium]